MGFPLQSEMLWKDLATSDLFVTVNCTCPNSSSEPYISCVRIPDGQLQNRPISMFENGKCSIVRVGLVSNSTHAAKAPEPHHDTVFVRAQGTLAYKRGVALSENPYSSEIEVVSKAWIEGWNSASNDIERAEFMDELLYRQEESSLTEC